MPKTLLNRLIPIRSFFLFPYFIMLITGLMVPSDGGHGFLSVKSLAFIGSVMGTTAYMVIRHQASWRQLKVIAFMLGAFIFLLTWAWISLLGSDTPSTSMLDQFKIFWLTLCVIAITLILFYEGLLSYHTFLKTLIYANLTYSCLKILLVILHFCGVLNVWDILDAIGLRYMKMGILGDLSRLQTSVDIITPFLILFVLQADRLGISFSRSFKIFYIVISIPSIFLSFSRFLIFISGVSLVLHWMTLNITGVLRGVLVTSMLMFAGVVWIGPETVYKVLEARLFSNVNKDSDLTRVNQINALLEEFEKTPLLGKGLGSYAESEIRDPINMHSYEVQWIAFLMQFGVIGVFVMLVALGSIVMAFLRRPFTRAHMAFLMLYAFWLLSGFTNPFLISLTSGIVYSLFMLTGFQLHQQTKQQLISKRSYPVFKHKNLELI